MATPTQTAALVVKSTGEVRKIAKVRTNGSVQLFGDADPAHWVVAIDATLPDGNTVRDLSGEDPGPFRQVGFAKVMTGGVTEAQAEGPDHVTGASIRNATQLEIDGWAGSLEAVTDAQDVELTKQVLQVSKTSHGRVIRALATLVLDEINLLRANAGMSARTKQQLLNGIVSKIEAQE